MSIRVRFAPSPTGFLHIGGARTALFNWLFSRSKNGQFILRIEDTDPSRSKKEYYEIIIKDLTWLGLSWDKLYHQSERLNIYRREAQKLVKKGLAYKTKEKGQEAIIYRMPSKNLEAEDLIHKKVDFDTSVLKDIVLIKSDGYPAYNFACVVDDALMQITHVIRGDDHLSNLPKQLLLYEALKYKKPHFAHIPLIKGEDKKMLSKRHGAVSVSAYIKRGYIQEGFFNYLLLLGWSPGNNQEIITQKEAIDLFSLDRVRKTSSIFDRKKLDWINKKHIEKYKTRDLTNKIKDYLDYIDFDYSKITHKKLEDIVSLYHNRIYNFKDFIEKADFFFSDLPNYNEKAVNKFLKQTEKTLFAKIIKSLEKIDNFNKENIEAKLGSLKDELNISGRKIFQSVRIAITGKEVSPGLFETLQVLGKKDSIKRLQYAESKFCR
jgi:glutamyl-tRNA synthetase